MNAKQSRWAFLFLLLLGSVFLQWRTSTTAAQTEPPKEQQKTKDSSTTEKKSDEKGATISLQSYREILEHERKLLDDQSKEYYGRIENLAYGALAALLFATTVLIGVLYWLFGQTRKEAVNSLKEDLIKNAVEPAKKELETLRKEYVEEIIAKYNELKKQLEDVTSISKRRIVWGLQKKANKPNSEVAALNSVGLRHIEFVTPESEKDFKADDADLVIISYDSSDAAKTLLSLAIAVVKMKNPPVSLLIYNYNPNGKAFMIDDDEMKQLSTLNSFAPANFPATLVSQSQSLILRKRLE